MQALLGRIAPLSARTFQQRVDKEFPGLGLAVAQIEQDVGRRVLERLLVDLVNKARRHVRHSHLVTGIGGREVRHHQRRLSIRLVAVYELLVERGQVGSHPQLHHSGGHQVVEVEHGKERLLLRDLAANMVPLVARRAHIAGRLHQHVVVDEFGIGSAGLRKFEEAVLRFHLYTLQFVDGMHQPLQPHAGVHNAYFGFRQLQVFGVAAIVVQVAKLVNIF